MISIERFSEILDELACELPEEFYEELNLGISISPNEKLHPQAIDGDLYILGEYSRSQIGQGIMIYYGSFLRLHSHLDEDALKQEMRGVLRHEFRHHMEYRAGERGLEIEDERDLNKYLGGN